MMGIEQFSRKYSALPYEKEKIRTEALARGKSEDEANKLVEDYVRDMETATDTAHKNAEQKFASSSPRHSQGMDKAA